MKNKAEEQCDVCAWLWPWVELRLINSVDDASVARHILFSSLITTFFFFFPSCQSLSETCYVSCETAKILVMQRIYGFLATEFECWSGIDALGEYMER